MDTLIKQYWTFVVCFKDREKIDKLHLTRK